MIQILKNELARRIEKNPAYSMRAFAKSLDMNIGVLSGLINGKRALTAKAADALCDKLGIAPLKKSEIILATLKNPVRENSKFDRVEIAEETFKAVSEWYHWAILQIVRTERYLKSAKHSDPKWMARELSISELQAKLAIERLISLNLLTRDQSGFLKRHSKNITIANKNATSAALKKWQRQLREKAIASLESDPIEVRSMTSITMAINPAKIKEAKSLIDEFQERLSEFLEQGSKKKVYQLCVSLYPLQKLEREDFE